MKLVGLSANQSSNRLMRRVCSSDSFAFRHRSSRPVYSSDTADPHCATVVRGFDI